MSAICGLIGSLAAETTAGRNLETMLAALTRRAAGEASSCASPEVRLAARRGPSGGGVVASGAQNRYRAVCDGSVFNGAAVSDYLRSRGAKLASAESTELLLELFIMDGVGAFRRVDGQFAVAIWDSLQRKLYLGRDFLGVIPLYYSASASGVAFASEIRSLITHPGVGRSYDLTSVSNYLTYLTVPGPATLFKGVRKLPPGHIAEFDERGNVTLHRFWDLADDAIAERDDAQFYIERVRELHKDAVRSRLPEGAVGAMLSGGNDSSANVALMGKMAQTPELVHTFTVGLEDVEGDPAYTDLAYAKKVAEFVGTTHHQHLMSTEEFLNSIPAATDDLDDLVSEPSSIFLRRALQLAKESGVRTVMTGEANDELCCGHGEMIEIRRGYYQRWQPYMRKPALVRKLAALLIPAISPTRRDILTRAARGEEYFWSFEIGWPQTAKAQILTPEAMQSLGSDTSAEVVARCRARFDRSGHAKRDYLNFIVYSMMQDYYFGNLMLGKLDLLARGLGLDARCPYTEPRYAQFVFNIPAQFKLRDNTVKWFFKKAIEGLLPDSIIYRPKQGFRTPVVELFKGRLGDWSRPMLLDGGFTAQGIVSRPQVARLLQAHRDAEGDYSNKLWTLMALNLWHERWLKS